MIGNQAHSHLITIKEFPLPENHTVKCILVFIKNTLPEFEVIFKLSDIDIYKEDDISKELSRFFNDKARVKNLLFQFNEKKGVDFTIYVNPYQMGAQSVFMIEAKRLSKAHFDYVSGDRGGIERIKREQFDFGSHLNQGAMIGYIQHENQGHWLKRINGWIEDLINQNADNLWKEEDKLTLNSQYSDYTSKHSRISKDPIVLFHYWITLN